MLWKSHRGIESGVSILYCSVLPFPDFYSQSTKPSKAITLPLIKKCGTSCSQPDSVAGKEEMHDKEFQQKHNLVCLGVGRSLTGTVHTSFVPLQLDAGSLSRRKNVP